MKTFQMSAWPVDGVVVLQLHSRLGVPLDFEALNTSMVYAPGDVQERCAK
jgi:hypothetical protein